MPIFCVKSVKIYTDQKKFTQIYSWRSWQISGMDIKYTLRYLPGRGVGESEGALDVWCLSIEQWGLRKWTRGLGKLTLLRGDVLTWEQGSAPSSSPRPSWHGHRPPRLDLPGVHRQILPQRPICVTDNRWQQCRQQHHWYVKRLQ